MSQNIECSKCGHRYNWCDLPGIPLDPIGTRNEYQARIERIKNDQVRVRFNARDQGRELALSGKEFSINEIREGYRDQCSDGDKVAVDGFIEGYLLELRNMIRP